LVNMSLAPVYHTKSIDTVGTEQFRVYFLSGGHFISAIHDIPLWADKEKGIANFVCEIPEGTRAKLELSKTDKLNPIRQDRKNGKVRYVHDPYPFNYGAFPQTWENPLVHDKHTDSYGDNDPIDVCEIGGKVHKTGDVVHVKILGVYAMIDAGETDWKIIAIDVTDPNADKYHSFTDIPKEKLDKVFTFLRDYKIPDGAGPNKFAFNSECQSKDFALEMIAEAHGEWHKIITGKLPSKHESGKYDFSTAATVTSESSAHITQEEAEHVIVDHFKSYLRAKN